MKRERHLFPESYRCLCELPPLPLKEPPLLLQPPPLLPEAFLLLQNDAVAQHGRRLLVALAAQLLLQERRRQWGFLLFFSKSDRRATVGVMGTWWRVEKANITWKTWTYYQCKSTHLEELLLRLNKVFAMLELKLKCVHLFFTGVLQNGVRGLTLHHPSRRYCVCVCRGGFRKRSFLIFAINNVCTLEYLCDNSRQKRHITHVESRMPQRNIQQQLHVHSLFTSEKWSLQSAPICLTSHFGIFFFPKSWYKSL